jgi:uncharacterized protein YkwD
MMVLVSGCYDGAGDDEGAADTDGGTGTSGPSGSSSAGPASTTADDDSGPGTQSTTNGADDTSDGDASSDATDTDEDPEVQGVCERWLSDRADMSEGSWSGSVDTCNAGDISAQGRANALRVMNLYRWLGGLPPVQTSADRDAMAQACALIMHANGQLSHNPPANWACYSADGAEGAGKSNISPTPGVTGVDLYMADPGNPDTLGHRRWILSNSIGPTGLGSTSGYSCMWTIGGTGNAGAPWMAFPPPGVVPYEAMTASWASVDSTGWSLQSDTIDLAGAQVELTRDGQNLPVAVHQLFANYGSAYAISITPQGWSTEAGDSIQVKVTGISAPIEYEVQIVGCGQP